MNIRTSFATMSDVEMRQVQTVIRVDLQCLLGMLYIHQCVQNTIKIFVYITTVYINVDDEVDSHLYAGGSTSCEFIERYAIIAICFAFP